MLFVVSKRSLQKSYGSDNFMQQRGNGFATYRNTDFFGLVDGLNFAVQYQGKNGSVSGFR